MLGQNTRRISLKIKPQIGAFRKRYNISKSHHSSKPYHSYDHPSPPGPFTPTQSKILAAALPHIPKYGFTQTSLSRGINSIGLIDAAINLFPAGAFSLVHYHLYSQRLALESCLSQSQKDQLLGTASKVKALTWCRLEANKDIIRRWSEALALMALPANVPTALKELSLLVDEIWFLSGDTSVDTSWYTKRASLATIYASTELFMTTDKSLNFEETRKFLDRRFRDIQYMGSTIGDIEQWGGFTMSAVANILRSKGLRI